MIMSVLFYVGIVAEAMSGAVAAGRYKVDLFGVFFIAFATALGGGSIRDVMLDHYPLLWIANPHYVYVVAISALIATRLAYYIDRLERFFLILDALGLAVFSTLGAKIAISLGHGFTVAMISGMVTGAFGGILRDVFCNTLPLILRKELYAVIAMLCGGLYWFLYPYLGEDLATTLAILCGFVLRILAIKYKISLPIFSFEKHQ
ncbi:trimeric intracellular cation channel family protein [uncultured Helicobacter sp.]|uniref:trimeric intracellular cation channel family protein n=1 Tax=uncultured Helicobacter sp. TaxID=175537 RepID=UPI00261091F7|nr:trimeric intracellular cation channel family protein [uncultured Helicobacter sp.]